MIAHLWRVRAFLAGVIAGAGIALAIGPAVADVFWSWVAVLRWWVAR